MTTPSKNLEQLTEGFLHEGLTIQGKTELHELLKDAENKDYFKKMFMIWHNAHHAGDEEYVEKALKRMLSRLDKQQQQYKRQEVHGWRYTFMKMAAAVVISFILGAATYHVFAPREKNSTPSLPVLDNSKVMVPLGSKTRVQLPDGTLVTLNAGSNIHYETSFGQETREVWLEGEGYFKVTKNSAIPFVVKAKDVTIKALGTEFNVKAYPEENTIQTTLVNGLVTVSQMDTPDNTQVITLKPKQTVTIYEQTATAKTEQVVPEQPNPSPLPAQTIEKAAIEKVEIKNDIKTELYTSWKDPRWVIESELLSDLAVKLQRRFDVQIIIADEALKNYPFTGTLTDETLEQILDIMKSIAPINYSVGKKTVMLKINTFHKRYFDELMIK